MTPRAKYFKKKEKGGWAEETNYPKKRIKFKWIFSWVNLVKALEMLLRDDTLATLLLPTEIVVYT